MPSGGKETQMLGAAHQLTQPPARHQQPPTNRETELHNEPGANAVCGQKTGSSLGNIASQSDVNGAPSDDCSSD